MPETPKKPAKTPKKRNWRTTASGVSALAMVIAAITAKPEVMQDPTTSAALIAAAVNAIGNIAAKDADKE